jgi:hypothetical protein
MIKSSVYDNIQYKRIDCAKKSSLFFLENSDFSNRAKVPKKSDFLEKSDFSKRAQAPKKSDFLEKSDFSKNRAQGAQEIFWKNRISKTVPRYPRNPIFLGKIGFLKPCQGTQEIRFFGKIGFLKKPCQGAQEIRFFGKIGFLKPCQGTQEIRFDFLGKIGFLKACQGTQEIRFDFLGKIGFLKACPGAQEIRFFGKTGFLGTINPVSPQIRCTYGWYEDFRSPVLVH